MVNVVHISDLHISEHLLRGAHHDARVPHRYGHNVQAFLALDAFLKDSEWDLLIITGDVSRIGSLESFEWVRNWLENEIVFGDTHVGLNLSKSQSKRYVIIPGNHDRFNGGLTQGSLDNYHQEFPVVKAGATESVTIGTVMINIHKFDSTWEGGGFGYGRVDDRSLVAKTLSDDHVDIAILHHHFLQPPKHPREVDTELTNSSEVAAYMLNSGFDGIFFGHTHKGYIGRPSVDVLSGLLNDRRKRPRFWTRLVPNFLLRRRAGDSLVAYKRETARNGQLPTLESYFNYIYLRQRGHNLAGPSSFDSIRQFYDQMNSVSANTTMAGELAKAKEKRVLISLAPSACQAEAEWNGFHTVKIEKNPDQGFRFEWDRYQFDGSRFCVKQRHMHVS